MLAEKTAGHTVETLASSELDLDRLVHDLRSPLSVIIAFAETLEDAGHDERARFTQRLVANAHRALALLEEFSALNDLRAGQIEVRPGSVDLSELVRQACMVARDVGSRAAETRYLSDGEVLVHADRDLLGMAVRAALRKIVIDAGSDNLLRLRVSAEDVFGVLEISLPDRGPAQAAVVDPSDPELEILQRVVALHGGRLVFEGFEDGLTVRVLIPRRSVEPVPLRSRRSGARIVGAV